MVKEKKKSPPSGQPGGETMGGNGTNPPAEHDCTIRPDFRKGEFGNILIIDTPDYGKRGYAYSRIPFSLATNQYKLSPLAYMFAVRLATSKKETISFKKGLFSEDTGRKSPTTFNKVSKELQGKGYLKKYHFSHEYGYKFFAEPARNPESEYYVPP